MFFYILCWCKAAQPHCLWEHGSLCSPWPLLLLLLEPIYGVTAKDVLPGEDPQGAQPGLRLGRGPITHPCDFPGAGSPKKHSQGASDTGLAPVASENTPCNCSLLLPSENVIFFKPAEEKFRIWGEIENFYPHRLPASPALLVPEVTLPSPPLLG